MYSRILSNPAPNMKYCQDKFSLGENQGKSEGKILRWGNTRGKGKKRGERKREEKRVKEEKRWIARKSESHKVKF